jgi:hypothetical protein
MRKLSVLLVLCCWFTFACDGPDLVPVQTKAGYCDVNVDGALLVSVKNQGNRVAGYSVVLIDFGDLGSTTRGIIALHPGDEVQTAVPLPQGCFNPDCSFRISVDAEDAVDESVESNNSEVGNCIG